MNPYVQTLFNIYMRDYFQYFSVFFYAVSKFILNSQSDVSLKKDMIKRDCNFQGTESRRIIELSRALNWKTKNN